MGARTRWYVQVFKIVEDIVEVQAVDEQEAREEAEKFGTGTGFVRHWSELEGGKGWNGTSLDDFEHLNGS